MRDIIKSTFINGTLSKGACIKNTLLMLTAFTVLTACNNSVEEVSRLPPTAGDPAARTGSER